MTLQLVKFKVTLRRTQFDYDFMTDDLWKILLSLKDFVYQNLSKEIHSIDVEMKGFVLNSDVSQIKDGFQILFGTDVKGSSIPTISVLKNGFMNFYNFEKNRLFPSEQLELYLPFCIAPLLREQPKTPLTITHFAQTLDGYIATLSNHSKWIGNDENLIHAHRLRALVDAVVIGNNTLQEDEPKLTVRHVEGKDPKKVVIGNSIQKIDSLVGGGQKAIRVVSNNNTLENNCVYECVRVKSEDFYMPTKNILEALYAKKIYSILIEGGSVTTSNFLKEENIDMLQLHIAPMVFGSGVKAFCLPEIGIVGEAKCFKNSFYSKIGNAMMFTGFLKNG